MSDEIMDKIKKSNNNDNLENLNEDNIKEQTLQVNVAAFTTQKNQDLELIEFDPKVATILGKSELFNSNFESNNLKKEEPKKEEKANIDLVKINDLIDERYRITAKLGAGAFAQVFEAYDIVGEKKVAIKIIKLHENKLKFQTNALNIEKESFAKLSFSQNVISLISFNIWNGMFYMAIELVKDGKTFRDKFLPYANVLSTEEFIYYYLQIAQGLSEIHQAQIVHRDIKPANIMITNDDIVKILDFGISKLNVALAKDEQSEMKFEGTPKFAAPEQILRPYEFDPRSDIYSVGIMMYISLTGVDPYTRFSNKQSKDAVAAANIQFHVNALRPSEYNSNIPPILDNIIMKCIAKDVIYRYQSFKELIYDLENVHKNINSKPINISTNFKSKEVKQTLKKNKNLKYKTFFSKFTWKWILPFFLGISIIVVTLILIILAS